MSQYNAAYLWIQTWIGRAPDASHYRGYITFKSNDYDVERRLTHGEAKDLNNREKLVYEKNEFNWRTGEKCSTFLDKNGLYRVARQIFRRKIVPAGAKILIQGKAYVVGPQPVIASTKAFLPHKKRLKELYKLWRYAENDEATEKLIELEWEKLLDEIH